MNKVKRFLGHGLGFIALLGLMACSKQEMAGETAGGNINDIAESYVLLALQFGEHDKHFVDAYMGPKSLRRQADEKPLELGQIRNSAAALRQALSALPEPEEDLGRLRRKRLDGQLRALLGRLEVVAGNPPATFDEESSLIFDTVAPDLDKAHFEKVIDELDQLVPGAGELKDRLAAFRDRFVIPVDKIEAAIDASINECRRRTLQHFNLPEGEGVDIELVNNKPWTAYNWYKGSGYSVIQINTDVPVYLERVIDFGCHEAYPGHHVYGIIVEQELLKKRGWLEYSVWPLFTSMALLGEGTANYGVSLAFTNEERIAFEKDVILPLAGVDPAGLEDYYQYVKLRKVLNFARNEAARDYLEGRISRAEAVKYLVDYGLESEVFAENRVTFIETYRSYVINYNHGLDLVSSYIEHRAGDDRDTRWKIFKELISSPIMPSDMK